MLIYRLKKEKGLTEHNLIEIGNMTYAQEKIYAASKTLACSNSSLYQRLKETLPYLLKMKAVDLPVEARKKFSDIHSKLAEFHSKDQDFYSDEKLSLMARDIMDILQIVFTVQE